MRSRFLDFSSSDVVWCLAKVPDKMSFIGVAFVKYFVQMDIEWDCQMLLKGHDLKTLTSPL